MRVRYSFGSRHTGNIDNISKQRRKYPDIASEIIRTADIILEVLDSRFVQETRNIASEEQIKRLGKKLIYVMNKCDLVDIPKKKEELKLAKLYPYVFVSCTQRKGSRSLRDKIKMEASRVVTPHEGMKRIQVGIIGYPNTGKSSLINFLTGKSSAPVGPTSGFTKGIQKVRLNSEILILDTPGVIPKSEYSTSEPMALSRQAKVNAKDYTKVNNPDFVIVDLMKEYAPQIEEYYGIKADGSYDTLIQELGKKMKFLVKGGEVNEDRTARWILKDWQQGNIKF